MRAHAEVREPLMRELWEKENVTELFFTPERELPTYTLHDGPPYANGDIHIGHALNKVLKDITVRAKRMAGYSVSFRPGWDCHGLPIELKILAENTALAHSSPVEFIAACRRYAQTWIETQERSFKNLGVCADWKNRYKTMDPAYEGAIVKSFGTLYEKGFIERKYKTVPWCASCKTVLATAEIEYADRKDPSCYVLFPLAQAEKERLFPDHATKEISFLIWTTTPWTLPLNRAVVLHPDGRYVLMKLDDTRFCIIGEGGVAALKAHLARVQALHTDGAPHHDTATGTPEEPTVLTSNFFRGATVLHPLTDRVTPLIFDDSVLLSEGTACVHNAPGCGPEDYIIALKNNLEIYSPLSTDGRYTSGIIPTALEGKTIAEGQSFVLTQLQERNKLLIKTSIVHSYPHCWRCRNGLMFRATKQWFCNLAHRDLQKKAVAALESITFVPSWGKQRLASFVGNRAEWCISRQRTWGIPIPALLDSDTEEAFTSAPFISYVASEIGTHGIEWWHSVPLETLAAHPTSPLKSGQSLAAIRKELDILDVWFDAGVSHTAVLGKEALPADLYLEGSDQHRGWFQSAVLTSLIMHDKAPMKTILTHGFIVDAQGHKMSKSRGNGLAPEEIVKKYGTDVLRLWVASVDYERDVVLSEGLLTQTTELYRKIRNTLRFLLANLTGFVPEKDSLPYDQLRFIDQYAYDRIMQWNEQAQTLYAQHKYAALSALIGSFSTTFLSALYFDMCKDTLYVSEQESQIRKSVQTVLAAALNVMARLVAPILPYTAEDVYQHLPFERRQGSIHLERFVPIRGVPVIAPWWDLLHRMRTLVLRAIEQHRATGAIKHSLEAAVTVSIDPEKEWATLYADFCLALTAHKEGEEGFMRDWYIVSRWERKAPNGHESTPLRSDEELPGFAVSVTKAPGEKCPRCWHFTTDIHEDNLCTRCARIVLAQ